MKTDEERFIHTCQDNHFRILRTPNGDILQQRLYANVDQDGNHLQYPETKWFDVPIVTK